MTFYTKLLFIIGLFSTSVLSAQTPTANFTETGERCAGQQIIFTSTSSTPIGTITNMHWDFNTGNQADTANGDVVSFSYPSSGNFLPTLTVTNTAGNTNIKSKAITINDVPDPQIITDVPCSPADVTFVDNSNVNGGSISSRVWNINSFIYTSSTVFYNPGATGTYPVSLEVTSDLGCSASVTENFDYGDKPIVTFSPSGPISICDGNTATIVVAGGASYIWTENGSRSDTKQVVTAGWQKVVASRGNNCSSLDSILVIIWPNPVAYAGEDVSITLGQNTTLMGSGGSNYTWSPSTGLASEFSSTTVAEPSVTTTYILTVTDLNGCSDQDSVTVVVELNTSAPVHNMLTPNGDGYNDMWDLSNIPNIETAEVYVYNRWGWEVFKSEEYKHNWQGTYKDNPLPDGTYIYVIKFANENQESLKGALEILRNTQK